MVLDCMSAWGVMSTAMGAALLSAFLSSVMVPAVPTKLTVPALGAVKLTWQAIAAPIANAVTGDSGVHVTVAPTGKPDTAQLAVAATLGPLLVHVTVPVTVLPAGAFVGKPDATATMSTTGVMPIDLLLTSLGLLLSCVIVPAVVLMFRLPDAGTVKVLVQVIVAPTSSVAGNGSAEQV
jgi:hypothetical protein